MSKQREIWLRVMNGHCEIFYQDPKDGKNCIHVIEKSAYDELLEKYKEVSAALIEKEDALDELVDVAATCENHGRVYCNQKGC